MPLALKIILGFFGYLLAGCFSTFLVPIWINLWEMANLEFSDWEYDTDIVSSLFDWGDDESFLMCFVYYLFWPIIFAIALAIWPIVFFFNVMKLLFSLPSEISYKMFEKRIAKREYTEKVEREYKKIMEREGKKCL